MKVIAVIDLSNAPNGIFAPYLVEYAIRQHGIQVDGFIRGIPARPHSPGRRRHPAGPKPTTDR